jgi:UrcA family protein
MIYIAFIAALAGSNASSPAAEPTAVVVPYADLNLGSGRGRTELNRRIVTAARAACDEVRLPGAAQQKRISECTKAALQRANRDAEVAFAKRVNVGQLARNETGGDRL